MAFPNRIHTYLSLLALLYFIFLIYVSYNPPESDMLIGIARELFTIPMLLLLLFSFCYSLYQIFKKENTGFYLKIFILNFITVALLVIVTIAQLNE